MMRIILGIVAFLVTFGFSVTLIGLLFGFPESNFSLTRNDVRYNSTTARNIETLLRNDVRNGRSRYRVASQLVGSGEETDSLYSNPKYRATVVNYVDTSSSMSDAGLPRDFQFAWRQHMKAWKKQAEYIKAFEGTATESTQYLHSDNTSEINQTWYQVLRIATRYGVEIDRSYYQ